ncbi:putative L-aspartate dehydrogenase [Pollicipes pollicipes]|uniref:putative L-aspartate dehydrogenase n=1 Tax=Pollicipes pollicipes TaxID=41117 RepID=UPI001885340B|nr:putative L-aspartate dehydrogenase [Pollicipes pollicipes]
MMSRRRVGIVGFGSLGQSIYNAIQHEPSLEIVFVWNRTKEVLAPLGSLALDDLKDVKERSPDLIVEVAHPSITVQYGTLFLSTCDYMIGSPTALADYHLESCLLDVALTSNHTIYIPSGAFWGGEDIKKMADLGILQGLRVTMRKHPAAFRLSGRLAELAATATESAVTLYEGPVRELCPQAPHNVNTMAAAALAAHNLGFDGVIGRLIADPSLPDRHLVETEVTGPGEPGAQFTVHTVRTNPAQVGAVTGSATFAAFHASVRRAHDRGPGLHLC